MSQRSACRSLKGIQLQATTLLKGLKRSKLLFCTYLLILNGSHNEGNKDTFVLRKQISKSSCLYIDDRNNTVKDMVSAREYVVRKYPDLPIYYIFFDRCIHRAPYFFISLRVSFQLFVSSLITFSSLPPICSNTNLTFVHDISLK